MATDVDIGNMVLGRLGTRATIASLTENSTEAREINRWYATVRDDLQSRIDWNFSRVYAALSSSGTPPVRWGYSYAYPSDCLKFRRIDLGIPVGQFEPQAHFEIGTASSLKYIWCNVAQATGVYSQQVTDPSRFEPDFVTAFADCLAAAVALPITQKLDLATRLEQRARNALEEAMASSANEQIGQQQIHQAESLSVRGYDDLPAGWPNWPLTS